MPHRITHLMTAAFMVLTTGCGSSLPVLDTLTPIDFKRETGGLRNEMHLYALNGALNVDEFRKLCVAMKSSATADAFTYIVVFDDKANAGFPTTPFTAMYGLEENRIKHIVAVFEYNAANGFCEMRIYDPNMWTGKPTTTKL